MYNAYRLVGQQFADGDSCTYTGLGILLTKGDPTGSHPYLTSGNAGGEVYGYDANGNQTGLSYYGSSYAFTFDDEDRLTNVTGPNGLNDSFAYTK